MGKKSVAINFIYQSAYQILLVITPLITSPYISRVLGAENIGTYSYYYSVAYYFGIFGILGVSTYGNRSIARCQNNIQDRSRVFFEIYLMQVFTSIIAVVGYLLYVFMCSGNVQNALIELFFVLSVCLDIIWFYFGIEEFKLTVIRSFIIKILITLLIFIFVKTQNDLSIYTFIMAGGYFFSSLILWIPLKKYVVKTKISIKNIMRHIKPNIILFIPVVSLALFHYTDKIMLGAVSTMEELGFYTNADKIINIPM